MSWLEKTKIWLANTITAALLGMSFTALIVHLLDRSSISDGMYSMYMVEKDVTCFVIKTRGDQLMSCLPGEYGSEETEQ